LMGVVAVPDGLARLASLSRGQLVLIGGECIECGACATLDVLVCRGSAIHELLGATQELDPPLDGPRTERWKPECTGATSGPAGGSGACARAHALPPFSGVCSLGSNVARCRGQHIPSRVSGGV